MAAEFRLLIINPGSTSTKIAVFDDENMVFEKTLRHSVEELSQYNTITDQIDFRKEIILKNLEESQIPIDSISAIVGRGGLLKPIPGGTYKVNEKMVMDLRNRTYGEHASNLGGIIAYEISKGIGVEAFIVDPVVVDELQDVARISGLKEIERKSIFHALNQKAVARRHAKLQGKAYEDMNLIVVHLGGGVSIGAHKKGRVIDVANALDGDGPFSPERSGGLPVGDLIKLCYSGKYSYEEMKSLIVGKGGMVSYLSTNNAMEVCDRIEAGDEYAKSIYYAMAYQIAKEIGSCAAVLKGEVDGILLTGGIAHDEMFTAWIEERVNFISKVYIYPGEDELMALAEGGLRVLRGEEKAKEYN
ncbi:MAG: butyrate kinase [Tissierellia bacterium]|nr:butyrate kinase [Tissierellia bacterium]